MERNSPGHRVRLRVLFGLGAALSLLGTGKVSASDTLFSYQRSDSGTIDHVTSTLRPSFFDEPADIPNPLTPSFDVFYDQPPLMLPDVGTTRVVTSANSAAFSSVAGLLTDGTPDLLTVGESIAPDYGGGGFDTSYEAYALYGNTGDPRVDLHGYQIQSFDLTLNQFSFVSDGHNTTMSFRYTVSIQGLPVPEPSSLAVLSLVGAALIWRPKRLRGHPSHREAMR
jgi:hypothetical protein